MPADTWILAHPLGATMTLTRDEGTIEWDLDGTLMTAEQQRAFLAAYSKAGYTAPVDGQDWLDSTDADAWQRQAAAALRTLGEAGWTVKAAPGCA